MQITVPAANSQICQAAIRQLLNDGSQPRVVGFYRNLEKVPSEFKAHANFTGVKADLLDPKTLDFSGSDAVLALTPPCYDGSDTIARARAVSNNIREAIARSGSVKRLVYVSSMGAQYAEGVGEVGTNHVSETNLESAAPEVVFLRNGFFMENWSDAIKTLRADPPHFYSYLSPIDYKMPMLSTNDIGKISARKLLETGKKLPSRPYICDCEGPQFYSARDVQRAFESILGKKVEARIVEKDQLPDFFATFLPKDIIGLFVEMTESFLPGGIQEKDFANLKNAERGQETLETALSRLLAETN